MDFGLSDSQLLLRRSIRELLERTVPIERVRRHLADSSGDRGLRLELGDQGITGLMVAEEHDGSGLGLLDATVAAQELGRLVTPISFHSSCAVAPLLIQGAGDEAQRRRWLPEIAAGRAVVTAALDLDVSPFDVSDREPATVADADLADAIVIHTEGDLLLVEAGDPGLVIEPLQTVDETRRVAAVRWIGGPTSRATRLASSPNVPALVARAEQAAQILLSADLLGACQRALGFAVDYARERRQFGRVIGSFQAVKHLCAETAAALEPLQSLLWYAAFAWDQRSAEAAQLAPLLKAHAAEVGSTAVTNTTQVMGGIGFTHECDMHLWFKRVGYDRQFYGAPQTLRAQAASLLFESAAAPAAG